MSGAHNDPELTQSPRSVVYVDADGRPTDDPDEAMRGEILEYDAHGRPARRTRFFLDQSELPSWVRVSEPAFLLWAVAALVVVWVAIAVVLRLT